MPECSPSIGWQHMGGTPREIGMTLGCIGRRAVHQKLLPSAIWEEVSSLAHSAVVARMKATTRQAFPRIWEELEGLAAGLELPLEHVLAWNCRGDLLASVPDGCTTLVLPGPRPLIAHNEDGLPFFKGHCFMAEVQPERESGFTAFCYPGSLPGHTLAFTRAGLVQAVNNLRLLGVSPTVPRMVLGRAVLGEPSVAAAVMLLRRHARSGGFHFTLAQQGQAAVSSVEFGAGEVSVRDLQGPAVHANHALHLPAGLAAQRITDSSRDRQRRGEALLAAGIQAPLSVLHDIGGDGLPILRHDPDDPDDENTLATAIMHLGPDGVAWQLHDRPGAPPAYAGHQSPANTA